MPLPEIEYHAEEVTVESVKYGRDDHGILTCTVFCEWGGSGQGFGNLILDERTGLAFVRDLCAFFGVEVRPGEERLALASLLGRRVRAIWHRRGGAMDGLELDGRRFMLWEWRRRMHPDAGVLDPRADRIASLRREIASRERRLVELRDELSTAISEAYDWSAIDGAAKSILAAGEAWRESVELNERTIALWANICCIHEAVGSYDQGTASICAKRAHGLASGIEALREPLERLCAELGV